MSKSIENRIERAERKHGAGTNEPVHFNIFLVELTEDGTCYRTNYATGKRRRVKPETVGIVPFTEADRLTPVPKVEREPPVVIATPEAEREEPHEEYPVGRQGEHESFEHYVQRVRELAAEFDEQCEKLR